MSKYKNCPSCGAYPEQLKEPGVRYSHSETCSIGRAEYDYRCAGCLVEPWHDLWKKCDYYCKKCGTQFHLKDYANAGDSHTKECPICWVMEEAKQNGKDQGKGT